MEDHDGQPDADQGHGQDPAGVKMKRMSTRTRRAAVAVRAASRETEPHTFAPLTGTTKGVCRTCGRGPYQHPRS